MAAKKKTVRKKKTATKEPQQVDDDFESWVQSKGTIPGCHTCQRADVVESIRALLQSMIRNRVRKIPLQEMHAKIATRHEDYPLGQRGFNDHLRACERTLYFQARGKVASR
jgi:hypothetical protein